ncbi:endonuclease MutS2 [Agrilactobacillus yilanensis]|uniref:Endonuclease MutS2 n=1 Tax=Agrilactobacillus yilanensis TaxID=2485997 RepID=A0ABW4J8H5_9LACO|nr:endonuclease MutS2 [Agrilactobacillus yilanensis]
MNQKILETLEFRAITEQLKNYAETALGQQQIINLQPSTDFQTVQQQIAETDDGAQIYRLKGGIPLGSLENIGPHLKRLQIGASLNGRELADISRLLRTTTAIHRFFEDLQDDEVALQYAYEIVAELTLLPQLSQTLRRSIDEGGAVLDEASTTLKSIRGGIHQLSDQIRSKMDNYTRGSQSKYLSEPVVTIRDDRYVIPVRSEYRGQFGGVIHDQSASGQTVYVEPQSVMDLNNRLRQQQMAEAQEVQRVLAELSEALMPYLRELGANGEILAHLDFMNAKARFANDMKATRPVLNAENEVDLKKARHPLIAPEKVVPNDIYIGKDFQCIVVTGPNTGGKTITLKTLGLIQLMAQSGLFIPAEEESQVGVFSNIFADIGDEQSIEQNLSTFSAHMENIISILRQVDDKGLVLLDELGAGTDPQEGASLAIAILDHLGTVGCYVVASTHYPELKVYGYERPKTVNASMEFDVATLQPTYRLMIGVPGRSNAFDISSRLGMPESIVTSAKTLLNAESQDLNNMISDLESQRKAAETEYLDLSQQLKEAQQLHDDLESAYHDFFVARENQENAAKEKANAIVAKAQEKADKIINDLRQMQLNGANTVKEDQLIAANTKLKNLHQEPTLKQNKVLRREKRKQVLKPGDDVKVLSYGTQGTLLEKVNEHEWQVQMGILKMKIATDQLQKVAASEKQAPTRQFATLSSSGSHVSTQLDLRGKRYDEAMADLDQYIDAALLAGYQQVTIVHGKGTGAIRTGVQEYLKNNRRIKKFSYAPASAGGNGATIVTF